LFETKLSKCAGLRDGILVKDFEDFWTGSGPGDGRHVIVLTSYQPPSLGRSIWILIYGEYLLLTYIRPGCFQKGPLALLVENLDGSIAADLKGEKRVVWKYC
jgi:hypothetical protein